ncbi:MAG: hypothetical protein AAF791_10000 [Bacteroidota bacterium]
MTTPDPNTEPRLVFAGSTATNRHSTAELVTYEDGETLVVTKTFMPLPDGFWDDFDADEGVFPGGTWTVLSSAECFEAEASESSGALFKTQGYTLPFAAWLGVALLTAVQRSGGEDILSTVTALQADETAEDGIADVALSEIMSLGEARGLLAERDRLRAALTEAVNAASAGTPVSIGAHEARRCTIHETTLARMRAALETAEPTGVTKPASRAVYLASRYSRNPEMREVRTRLESIGYTVTSRWINGDHQIDDEGLSVEASRAERERFAREDLEDLRSASICISFSEVPRSTNSRGGRHVEHGYALALGKRCIVVGPRENVFHCGLGVEVYENTDEMIAALTATSEAGETPGGSDE